jgi:hypothetical protein
MVYACCEWRQNKKRLAFAHVESVCGEPFDLRSVLCALTPFSVCGCFAGSICDCLFDDFSSAHVWSEGFRDHDAAVFLLIVLEDGCNSSSNCKAGAVESVDEFRLGAFVASESDVGSSCLEIFEVGAA